MSTWSLLSKRQFICAASLSIVTRVSSMRLPKLVSRAALHEAYSNLGHPPFGHTKKLKRLHQIIKIEGPITSYRDDIQPWLDEFAQYEDHRHFLAHAIMVPRSREHISFTMYDHREGVYSVGQLELELKHLEVVATLDQPFIERIHGPCRQNMQGNTLASSLVGRVASQRPRQIERRRPSRRRRGESECINQPDRVGNRVDGILEACMAVKSGMTHIAGFDRSQLVLLPEAVDDYVGADNPVRIIDAFVAGL